MIVKKNLGFERLAGYRWCPGWRRWPASTLCCCPSLGTPVGTWRGTITIMTMVMMITMMMSLATNLMAVVGELWSTKVCNDLARTTATSRRSISRNVKNPSVRLCRERRWGWGKSFELWKINFTFIWRKVHFSFICWENPDQGWGPLGPSLIRDLTWLFTEWLFISRPCQACASRGVQLKSRPNRTNCLVINLWYVQTMTHANYALNGRAWMKRFSGWTNCFLV